MDVPGCRVGVLDCFDNRGRRFRYKQDQCDRRGPLVDFKGVSTEMTTVLPPSLQQLRSDFLPFLATAAVQRRSRSSWTSRSTRTGGKLHRQRRGGMVKIQG